MEENEGWGEPLPEPVVKPHKLSAGQLAYQKAKTKKAAQQQPVEEPPKKMLVFPEPEQTQHKRAAVRKAAAKKPVVEQKGFTVAVSCSICGKPLTRPDSIAQGHGDICDAKVKLLPSGTTMAEHYTTLQAQEVPQGFLLLKDVIQQARVKGCSGYRFMQACGKDRLLRPPFNKNFKVVFVKGKRYVSRLSLGDLSLLKKV